MLEMLIIAMCLGEKECPTLTKAYLQYNQEVKQNINYNSKLIVKEMTKEGAVVSAITYGALVRHKLRTRLPYRLVFEWNFKPETEKTVDLSWRYDF